MLDKFWGKTNRDKKHHLLVYHLLDVAASADVIFTDVLPQTVQNLFHKTFKEKSLEESLRVICFLIALHDLGKLSPAFQSAAVPSGKPTPKNSPRRETALNLAKVLESHGFDMTCEHAYHADLSASSMAHEFPCFFKNKNVCIDLFRLIGGHHGKLAKPSTFENQIGTLYLGENNWVDARRELVLKLQELFKVKNLLEIENIDATVSVLLAGLTAVADWVGSNEYYFPFRSDLEPDITVYYNYAKAQARKFIKTLNWNNNKIKPDINAILGGRTPLSLQKKAMSLAKKLDRQSIVIIEANTGGGKTEASMLLAQSLIEKLDLTGFYCALPTMASSNQQYLRLQKMWEPLHDTPLQLAHSENHIAKKEFGKLKTRTYDWFADGKKRTLLAPFGVGSIDQMLLSSLSVNHFFVRMFGLANKVVILDEVHAYDTFMYDHIQNTLRWLRILNCSVIILSATLPEDKKKALMEAYCGQYIEAQHYPSITWAYADGSDLGEIPLVKEYKQKVRTSFISRDYDELVEDMKKRTKQKGCICLYVNYPDRAKTIARRLAKSFPRSNVTLLDSRFLKKDRASIENKIVNLFGKENGKTSFDRGNRPEFHIVVSTQILEQSMDLDFDLIYTDLCPTDLLFQRKGRLWRHPQSTRPFPNPEMVILMPEEKDGIPDFDFWKTIPYSAYYMLRSWYVVKTYCKKFIHGEKKLVEKTYGQVPNITNKGLWSKIQSALESFNDMKNNDEHEAGNMQVSFTDSDLRLNYEAVDEQDEREAQLTTRRASKSVQVIAFNKNWRTYSGAEWWKEDKSVLIQHSFKLQIRGVVKSIEGRKFNSKYKIFKPERWKKDPIMKHYYLARFDFQREFYLKNYKISDSSYYGLFVKSLESF